MRDLIETGIDFIVLVAFCGAVAVIAAVVCA
jgi:hypothetical protein